MKMPSTSVALLQDRPILSTIFAGVTSIYLWKCLRQLYVWRGVGENVPQAKGWLPIVGHLLTFLPFIKDNNKLGSGRYAIAVEEREGKDIFAFEAAGMTATLVSNLDLVEEIVTGDPHKYTKDFSALGKSVELMFEIFGESGLFFAATDDPRWQVAHSILKAPFSTRGVKALFPMMTEQADMLVKGLKRDVGFGGVCHIDRWVTKMAFETIAVCGLGTSFDSFADGNDHPFIAAMNNMISGMLPFAALPKCLWSTLLGKRLKALRADGKLVRDTCIDVIRKRRAHETCSSSAKRDLLEMMLNDKDSKTGQSMTEEMIVDNVLTFLFAGQDSTAAAMASCMCFLNANPLCKEKLYKEIDEVVGSGELEWDHLSKLHYLDWCIKETLRLVPPAAAVARAANGNQLLGGKWRIPDKHMLIISVMSLHYDEKLWGKDAKQFRPERWENGPPHKYAWMPFALGPRACTGREFTVIEQKITFVKLLQHFDFRRPSNVEAEKGYTTLKKEDQTMVPFIDMDVEFKTTTAFIGIYSAFQLLERQR